MFDFCINLRTFDNRNNDNFKNNKNNKNFKNFKRQLNIFVRKSVSALSYIQVLVYN